MQITVAQVTGEYLVFIPTEATTDAGDVTRPRTPADVALARVAVERDDPTAMGAVDEVDAPDDGRYLFAGDDVRSTEERTRSRADEGSAKPSQ